MGIKMFSTTYAATLLLIRFFSIACFSLHADEPVSSITTNAAAGSIENSVVKIFSTVRYPDPSSLGPNNHRKT
jgi:hypothetical protein